MAIVLQHEVDHLNGKLILDHISFVKRKFIIKKLKNGEGYRDSEDEKEA